METLHFETTVAAPVEIVWDTMLSRETYAQWTASFSSGSDYEGSWDEGTEVTFFGIEDDGTRGGLIGRVVENRPHERVTVRFTGQVVNGVVDTASEAALALSAYTETYQFVANGAETTVKVSTDVEQEEKQELEDGWTVALVRLKELAEERSLARSGE
jgi:uncharacterized protein YndB with AHSA1/START domain